MYDYGPHSYALSSYGLHIYGLYSYGLCMLRVLDRVERIVVLLRALRPNV